MGATAMAKRAARRVVPSEVKAIRNFLHAEARSPVRFSQPELLRHGYHSSRRWLYPERPVGRGYISDVDFLRRIGSLNPLQVQRDLADKLAFAERMEAGGFGDRVPRLLGISRDGRFQPVGDPSGGEVIIKPVDGRAGQGIAAFETLDAAVAACPPDHTYLVQERVRAHPYGREIFAGSLNALRVQVIRTAPGATPTVAVVVQRIGTSTTVPGHAFSTGGLLARVTPDGTLTYALGPVRGPRRDRYDDHHETGARITGRPVGYHREALDLALQAMELYPEATYVGWDIAIAETGPVVLEGNATWPNLAILQAHGPFADDPAVRRYLVERRLLRTA